MKIVTTVVLFVCLVIPHKFFAQDFDSVKAKTVMVVDMYSLKPLDVVFVHSKQPNNTFAVDPKEFYFRTNKTGKFLLNDWWFDYDSFSFSKFDYKDTVMTLSQIRNSGYVIYLVPLNSSPNYSIVSQKIFREDYLVSRNYQNRIYLKDLITFRNVPELLRQTGDVFVQKDNQAGGSPIVWGFEGNRTVQMLDGVKLNHLGFGNGHENIAARLDVNAIGETETAFGANGVFYGSGALGGVTGYYSKSAYLATDDEKRFAKFDAMTRFSSVNLEKTGTATLHLATRGVASLTTVSYSGFDDLLGGNRRPANYVNFGKRYFYQENINGNDSIIRNENFNRQVASGYNQINVTQKFALKMGDHVRHYVNLYYSRTPEVPMYDLLSTKYKNDSNSFVFGEANIIPDNWMMGMYRMNVFNTKFFDMLTAIVAYQKSGETMNLRYLDSTQVMSSHRAWSSITGNLYARKEIAKKNDLTLGMDLEFGKISSSNLLDATNSISSPAFPDSLTKKNEFGWYIFDQQELKGNFNLSAGIRYTKSSLDADFQNGFTGKFADGYALVSNNVLAGEFGIVKNFKNGLKVSLNSSTGFRTPNATDFSYSKLSDTTKIWTVNNALTPERVITTQLNIRNVKENPIAFSVTPFYTMYMNGMEGVSTGDTLINGSDTLAEWTIQNSRKGSVFGAMGTISVRVGDHFRFSAVFNQYFGKVTGTDTSLDHIPPGFGRVGVTYYRPRLTVNFWSIFTGPKPLEKYGIGASENKGFATANGMPTAVCFNLRASFALNWNFNLEAGLENILNSQYRYYSSGISEAGRNAWVALRVSF